MRNKLVFCLCLCLNLQVLGAFINRYQENSVVNCGVKIITIVILVQIKWRQQFDQKLVVFYYFNSREYAAQYWQNNPARVSSSLAETSCGTHYSRWPVARTNANGEGLESFDSESESS